MRPIIPSNERESLGICVVRRDSEGDEALLKRFKRKVTKSEILKEFKKTIEYVKPSVKRRKKKDEAKRRREKELSKHEKEIEKFRKKKGAKKHENSSSGKR